MNTFTKEGLKTMDAPKPKKHYDKTKIFLIHHSNTIQNYIDKKEYEGLLRFAIGRFDDYRDVYKFKEAIEQTYGIVIGNLVKEKNLRRIFDLTKNATDKITLYSDAAVSYSKFGICREDGLVIWTDYLDERVSTQNIAETKAAIKAVELAVMVRKYHELDFLRLNLMVDSLNLMPASHVMGDIIPTQQDFDDRHTNQAEFSMVRELSNNASKLGILLYIYHVLSKENLSDPASRSYEKIDAKRNILYVPVNPIHRPS